jgi:hypothetical protein
MPRGAWRHGIEIRIVELLGSCRAVSNQFGGRRNPLSCLDGIARRNDGKYEITLLNRLCESVSLGNSSIFAERARDRVASLYMNRSDTLKQVTSL